MGGFDYSSGSWNTESTPVTKCNKIDRMVCDDNFNVLMGLDTRLRDLETNITNRFTFSGFEGTPVLDINAILVFIRNGVLTVIREDRVVTLPPSADP